MSDDIQRVYSLPRNPIALNQALNETCDMLPLCCRVLHHYQTTTTTTFTHLKMVKFTTTALAAAVLSSSALSAYAAPAPAQQVAALPTFHRQPAYETFGQNGAPLPPNLIAVPDSEVALGLIASKTGVDIEELTITNEVTATNGVHHIYAARLINGKPVANQVANVSIKNGKVISFGHSFPTGKNLAPPPVDEPAVKVKVEDAIATAEKTLGVKKNEIEPTTRYVENEDGALEFVHTFQLQSELGAADLKWYSVDVSAVTGNIVAVNNWVHDAKYRVVDFRKTNPLNGITTVTDPAIAKASPNGWHKDATTEYAETKGNNAYVYYGRGSSTETLKASNNEYLYNWDATKEPTIGDNKKISIANNFYVTNSMHDFLYQYGFTEAAGNFQSDNFGKGGKGGDPVYVYTQNPSGTNNANFATPPDGQRPTMNMFIFTQTTPKRDASLENGIGVHEYAHGLTNRMTGGPANSNCLQTTEAGGMGEGWGDTLSIFLTRTATSTRNDDVVLGDYVMGDPAGIRTYPYSTSTKTNPLMYSVLATRNEVHAIGELWTSIWNEIYWNLVEKTGFSNNVFDATTEHGNIVATQLLVDALPLQPCNPTFRSARDAILQADVNRYDGKHKCEIWNGFAKRGLGVKAVAARKDDFTLPEDCPKTF
ncbi:Fungalysin metallopeptidase-domain-containing protein [Phlyctochytrium arcticum]|nr:Fungalysin metallopeptidase-domain-containing protein [Phlyctochytrium arcticum]